MNEIVVSIITISYNCKESIGKTINSVLCQDYPYIEYIIIDGASNDGTQSVIDGSADRIRKRVWSFKYLSERDKGISDAFNKGISRATGELVLLLNAGDVFVGHDVVTNAVTDWEKENKPDFLYYRVKVGTNTYIPSVGKEELAWETCQQPHQGSFIRKKLYSEIGGYNADYKLRMDYDFFMRCKEYGASHKYIPRVIVDYELGGASMQTRNAKAFYLEGMDIKRKNNVKIGIKEYFYAYMPSTIRKLAKLVMKR